MANSKVLELRRHEAADSMLVTMTASQLRTLVANAVVEALAEYEAGRTPPPELLNGADMARALGISRTSLHRLRVQGCPAVRIGDGFRYRPRAVLAWLEHRRPAPTEVEQAVAHTGREA
jgi:hypothetical protein